MAEFIVAIELGSSKMTGIAGKKNLDGSINVLAVVKEDSTSCIRKGVAYNIDKTVQTLTNIVAKLERTLMLVNGTEPRCGVMNHYGWYEDAGYKEMKTLEGKWQHVYVCFDGRIESIYINDKLISQKDIQLLVKPSQFMLLGKNAEEAWPFSGYLHSLKLWDEYIPYKKTNKIN